ncbi:hypothetical protein STENM36S_07940 [Streptomyces tendae]
MRPGYVRQRGVRVVGGGEVAEADDADRDAAVLDDDREPAHGMASHQLGGAVGGVVGSQGDDGWGRAHRADRGGVGVPAVGDTPEHDVAVGEDTEQVAVVGKADVADVLLAHQPGRPRHGRHGLDGHRGR